MTLRASLLATTGEANRDIAAADPVAMRRALLAWYRPRRTAYPWRGADPFGVLVSEVMLQQTQAARVVLRYVAFVERFPSGEALAAASRAEVLRAWGNLGYPRRAVALHEAARAVVRDHGGRVPADPAELRLLPGVGPYTAAAVASLGHGRRVPALDTNVRRVVARARLGAEPHGLPAARLAGEAAAWMGRGDSRSFTQAVMDLGREVCRPRPRCDTCPLRRGCRFRLEGGRPERSPRHPARFQGSLRQVRGAVLAELRERDSASMARLAAVTGHAADRVRDAVRGLAADGVVAAGPVALAGGSSGRVRLPG